MADDKPTETVNTTGQVFSTWGPSPYHLTQMAHVKPTYRPPWWTLVSLVAIYALLFLGVFLLGVYAGRHFLPIPVKL